MSSKIKIVIFPLLLAIMLAAVFLAKAPALRAGGEAGGDLLSFSGSPELRDALWKLAAFVPAGEVCGGSRTLEVSDIKGLPPVVISLTYGEPLDPWPSGLKLTFQAEAGKPPLFLTLSDRRPFGGPNIELDGPGATLPGRNGDVPRPLSLMLDLLTNLNARLLAARPRLSHVNWAEEAPGFESARAKLLYGARLGPGDLYLLRFDPAQFSFRPYHEMEYHGESQAAIGTWAERLGEAVTLINGGQYYPDRSYMGCLKRDGRDFSQKIHRQWKGFIVSEPKPDAPPGIPPAAVIDLEESQRLLRPEYYQNVMQSFMLLDHKGLVRVRESRNLTGRTALGEDGEGRLIVIMSPAAISLYDLAMVLKSPALNLKRVMALDGGFESQIFMRRRESGLAVGSQFSITDSRAIYLPAYRPTLPAVLAVERRRPEPSAETHPEEAPPEERSFEGLPADSPKLE